MADQQIPAAGPKPTVVVDDVHITYRVHGSHGGYAAKRMALEHAGVTVFGSLEEMTERVVAWHAARSTR